MGDAGQGGGDAKDGRALRAAKNHEAIVRAVYELVRETHETPSVEAVAARAGVGTRTVFRQFDDLEGLYRSMSERVQEEVLGLLVVAPLTGRLDDDLPALVARRARIFEHVLPFRRAVRHARHRSPFLLEQDAVQARLFRAALATVLEPHLRRDAEHAEGTLEALDALLSFDVWDRMRGLRRHSAKRAEQILAHAALVLAREGARSAR